MSTTAFHARESMLLPASVQVSRFRGASGVDEYHLVARPTEDAGIHVQLAWLEGAYYHALEALGLEPDTAVLRRFFAADLPRHASALAVAPFSSRHDPVRACAVSWVGQPPLPPAKVALWAYHVHDPAGALDKTREGASLVLRRGELSHLWTTGVTPPRAGTSYQETRGVFDRYEAYLNAHHLRLADHVIRTWLFVRDIDANYQGMVEARREFFVQRGLTAATHYIASSGINGAHADSAATVGLDAYAIAGVGPEQIQFLAAPDYLPPTHLYGVTFERGTSVGGGGRPHGWV